MTDEQDQIAALRRITEQQDRELDRLRSYVEADCHCPCCDTDRHCMEVIEALAAWKAEQEPSE